MTLDILTNLVSVLETGSEEDVRTFVRDHWTELPPKLQDQLGASILIDKIVEHDRQSAEFEAFRQSFLDLVEELPDEEAAPSA